MSLDWNVNKIKNHDQVCFTNGEMNHSTEMLIFLTMVVGINQITEKNAREFYERLAIYERLSGAFRTTHVEGGGRTEVRFTPQEVEAHIGLSTNADSLTANQFAAKIMKRLRRELA